MGLKDFCDFSVIENEAERMVVDEMERQLGERGEQMSEDDLLDIATFALNRVKPAYRVTLLGRLYARAMENTDYIEQVRRAVQEGIAKIG
jgi:competence protein ComFB